MKKVLLSNLILSLLIIVLSAGAATAQKQNERSPEKPVFWFGPFASLNVNLHSADFANLPNTSCCSPGYGSGSGLGYSFGALFIYPLRIKGQDLRLDFRLGYNSLGADLVTDEWIGNTRDNGFDGNGTIKVNTEHKIESALGSLGLDLGVDYYFLKGLYGTLGLRLGYILTGTFSQQELITEPSDITFSDGTRVRNVYKEQDIPELNSFQAGLYAGIGYDLPIGKELYLTPEAKFYYNFTNISSDTIDWKPHFLYIGVALKIPVIPSVEKPVKEEVEYVRDTMIVSDISIKKEEVKLIGQKEDFEETELADIIIRKKIITENYELRLPKTARLDAALEVAGIAPDGTRQANPTLVIEEVEAEEGFPLLPYVFFRNNSATFDGSGMNLITREETRSFDEQKLPWNTLSIYSDLLNIVGSRMRARQETKLTITGCNNNLGPEENNLQLSQDRADAVRNYLVNTWNVDPSRITVKKQGLPANPANNTKLDGQVENQRAELSSDDYELLKYLTQKDVIRTSTPPRVEIKPSVQSEAGMKSWKIEIEQGGKVLREFSGEELPPSVEWNVEEQPMPEMEAPVLIKLTAVDEAGNKTQAVHETSINQLTINKKRYELKEDKRIERFSLILFDFDKATLSKDHNKIIADINKKITPQSSVTVYGYADRIGTPEYNKQLADKRIQETKKLLNVNPGKLEFIPVGSDVLLYPNETPQGRCYSRTVKFEVETPLGK